jgi:hypothetical protein
MLMWANSLSQVALASALIGLIACSDDSGPAPPDGDVTPDAVSADASPGADANHDDANAAADVTSSDQALSGDARYWDAGGRPYGQCVEDSDCYWGLPCALEYPGGLCTGCSLPSDCGDSFTYDCVEGTCKRLCIQDTHCPLGHTCSSHNWCEPVTCGSGDPPCPAPYVCGAEQHCTRPPCAASAPPCPQGMVCGAEETCVENYD